MYCDAFINKTVWLTSNAQISPLAADLDHVLIHTEGLWEAVRGKAVFITGGTGFFGRWLLLSFAEANRRLGLGAQAIVLTRNPRAFRVKVPELAEDASIKLVSGDARMLDFEKVRSQSSNPFSHIVHAASATTESANLDHPEAVIETAFEGTRRTLDFAEDIGAENFLLISSGAVYGEQPVDLSHVSEGYSGAPDVASLRSAYGEGKRVAELLCNARGRSKALHCKIARCFAFVGPYLPLDAHYAIGNFIRDTLNGQTIQVKGDGTPFRSYLYAADLAIWLWTILLHPSASGVYNVGSDDAHSIREIAGCVSRYSPRHPPVAVAEKRDARRQVSRYVPDVSRARRELGLGVWTPLDAAIRKTIEFHQRTRTSV